MQRRNMMMEQARREFEAEQNLNRRSQRARAAAAVTSARSLSDLRDDYERLQAARMERLQREAEEKMLLHWKINHPDLREVCHQLFFFSRNPLTAI